MKEAINHIGDKYGLPNGWLNNDFIRTKSYTPKLIEFSVYYKTFSGILTVRTILAEYLIAMKLKSGRRYKNDLSDVVGIIGEHIAKGKPLTYEQIDKAVCDLYGSWDAIFTELREFVISLLEQPNDSALYEQYKGYEKQSMDILLEVEQQYPNVANKDNIDTILEKAKLKKQLKNEPDR